MTRQFLLAAAFLVHGWALAQIPGVDAPAGSPAQRAAPATPRANTPSNDAFRKLRAQCEAAACSVSGGDACAEAAAMLTAENPPEEFFDLSGALRTRFAIRLLEKGTPSSNLARARAYDIYSSFGVGALLGFGDSYRARELEQMMLADKYPGIILRQARAKVGLFHMGASEEEKQRSCAVARDFSARGGLDADGVRLAREILATDACTPQTQPRP